MWCCFPLNGKTLRYSTRREILAVAGETASAIRALSGNSGEAPCRLRLGVYPSSQVLQLDGRLCHLAPASHLGEEVMSSRAPSLHGRYPASSLLRTRPPPSRLRPTSRGMPVIRPTWLRRFLGGTRTASPVAQRILATLLPLPPRRSESTRRSGFVDPCCLRLITEGSASGVQFVSGPPMGSLALRPGDSLTIPRMALSVGFRTFGFPPCLRLKRQGS